MDAPLAFTEATAVTRLDPDRYTARIAPEWGIRDRPNGGYLMAIAARAALAATGRTHPHAVTASFVRPAATGVAEVDVETVRSGRQVTQVRCRVRQGDGVVLDALLALGDRPSTEVTWSATGDPLPPFDACVPVPHRPGRVGLLERLDIRYDPAASPVDPPSGTARVRGWVAFRDGADDPLAPLLVADVLPPTIQRLGLPGWAPTVQMSTYLRAVPAPGPLAVSVRARLVAGGWFDEVSDVYDVTGVLVAQGRQLALVPEEVR